MTRLPRSLTRVTTFSKLVALFVIAGFLVSAFYAGFLFNQKYGSAISSITPTPTSAAAVNDQTSCSVDSDCTLADMSDNSLCCPNIKCSDYSKDYEQAVNTQWFTQYQNGKCGTRHMCPMIAMMCAKGVLEENAHYSAKCISHVCTKVRN